jgi:hypothetical protein
LALRVRSSEGPLHQQQEMMMSVHCVHQVKPKEWARYRAKCAYYAPKLAMLRDLFEEIAAGKHDHDPNSDHTVMCVDCELEMIRDELNDSFEDVSRYATDPADVL